MSDEEPKLYKEYTETISQTNRFLVYGLSSIILLAIFIEFKIWDRHLDIQRYQEVLARNKGQISAHERELSRNLYDIVRLPDWGEKKDILNKAKVAILKREQKLIDDLITDLKEQQEVLVEKRKELKAQKRKAREEDNILYLIGSTLGILTKISDMIPPIKQKIKNTLKLEEETNDKLNELFKEQSIPTPFGSFKIKPRLALIMLTFASVLVYIRFYLYVNHIASIATLLEDNKIESSKLDSIKRTPFWYYPRTAVKLEPNHELDLHRIFGGLLFHIGYLMLCVVLTYECIRWNRVQTLWFSNLLGIRVLLLLAISAITILVLNRLYKSIEIKHLIKKTFEKSQKKSYSEYLLDRRAFLAYGATVSGIIGVAIWRGLIPISRSNRLSSQLESMEIQESLTEEDREIPYLKDAIENNPLSYHLYDRLTRVYGKVKKYDRIREMLDKALILTKDKLEAVEPGSKDQRRWMRAEKEFNMRLMAMKKRKQKSEAKNNRT